MVLWHLSHVLVVVVVVTASDCNDLSILEMLIPRPLDATEEASVI